jgi:hypothetical protein
VVDVGANIGWFMLNAAAAKGRVVAFEGEAYIGQHDTGMLAVIVARGL